MSYRFLGEEDGEDGEEDEEDGEEDGEDGEEDGEDGEEDGNSYQLLTVFDSPVKHGLRNMWVKHVGLSFVNSEPQRLK